MADPVELADSLYDTSIEAVGTISPGASPYKIRVSAALQAQIADHEIRIEDLEAGGGGSGDVTAASSFSNDNRVIRSDGTGKGVQASSVTMDDSGNVTGMGTLNTRTIASWVDGPGSATDNAIVRFDGTTGKLVQNSAVTVADTTGSIDNTGGSGTMTSTRFIGPATALRSASTDINVSAATAPSSGQVLTATSSTTAAWQSPTGAVANAATNFTWSSNTATIDVSLANHFVATNTMTGSATLTLSNGVDGCRGKIYVKQDGTGSRTLSFTISGRTVLKSLNVNDTNPQSAANSYTVFEYSYETIVSTAVVVILKGYLQ